jgi:hypothetical protein
LTLTPSTQSARAGTSSAVAQLSSAIRGRTLRSRTKRIPARSRAATGCSTNSTPNGARSRMVRTACWGVQAPLASTTRRAPGTAPRTASTISASLPVPTLILRIGKAAAALAFAAMAAGSSSPME